MDRAPVWGSLWELSTKRSVPRPGPQDWPSHPQGSIYQHPPHDGVFQYASFHAWNHEERAHQHHDSEHSRRQAMRPAHLRTPHVTRPATSVTVKTKPVQTSCPVCGGTRGRGVLSSSLTVKNFCQLNPANIHLCFQNSSCHTFRSYHLYSYPLLCETGGHLSTWLQCFIGKQWKSWDFAVRALCESRSPWGECVPIDLRSVRVSYRGRNTVPQDLETRQQTVHRGSYCLTPVNSVEEISSAQLQRARPRPVLRCKNVPTDNSNIISK